MDVLTLFSSVIIVLFAWMGVKALTGRWLPIQPTLLGVAFAALLFVHYIPSILFLNDVNLPRADRYHWATVIALCMLPLGAGAMNLLFHLKPAEVKTSYQSFAHSVPSPADIRVLYILGGLCLVIFFAYLVQVPTYPFYQLISRTASTREINAARSLTSGREVGSSFWYVYTLTRTTLMPLLFLCILTTFRELGTLFRRSLAVGAVIMVLVYTSWSSAKTPVSRVFALVLLLVLIGRTVDLGHRRFGRRRRGLTLLVVVIVLGVAVGYPIFVFSLKNFGARSSIVDVLLEGVLGRVFYKPAFLTYFQFEIFPDQLPFTNFQDVAKFSSLFGTEFLNLSRTTAFMARGAIHANAPPASIGNFYAQGSWPVVVGGFFLVGASLQGLQVWLARRVPQGVFAMPIVAFLCWGAFRLSMTSFHTILLTETVVPAMIFVILWRAARSRRSVHGSVTPRPVRAATQVRAV